MDYKIIEEYIGENLANNANGHGVDHAKRVVKNVKLIVNDVDCDLNICIISAYVHDVIDPKVADDPKVAEANLCSFLLDEVKLTKKECDHILEICNTISYSKNAKLNTIEAKVVQDADRLDALGAVGIARTIEYSASVSRPIYIEGDKSNDTAIGHFHAKLYKLADLMNFEVSKRIARDKMEIMHLFEQQIIQENIDDN